MALGEMKEAVLHVVHIDRRGRRPQCSMWSRRSGSKLSTIYEHAAALEQSTKAHIHRKVCTRKKYPIDFRPGFASNVHSTHSGTDQPRGTDP